MTALSASKLSVVIPCRNGGSTLAEQLTAFTRQIEPPLGWELIVVDNGSTDDSVEIATRFADRIPRLSIVEASARPGINVARNVGARIAEGDVLLFCDADDVVHERWLFAMHRAFMERRVSLAGGTLCPLFGRDGAGTCVSGITDSLEFLPWPRGANCGMRRELFINLGGFNELYRGGGDETELFWRAQLQGETLSEVPSAIVYVRERASAADVWRQRVAYGSSHVKLFAEFRFLGMPRPDGVQSVVRVARVPGQLLLGVLFPARRRSFWGSAALTVGRILGSFRERIWYV